MTAAEWVAWNQWADTVRRGWKHPKKKDKAAKA